MVCNAARLSSAAPASDVHMCARVAFTVPAVACSSNRDHGAWQLDSSRAQACPVADRVYNVIMIARCHGMALRARGATRQANSTVERQSPLTHYGL